MGSKIKKLATIVFFYTRYWYSTSHFSPGTGVLSVRRYTKELVDQMKRDPEKFSRVIQDFRSGGSVSSLFCPMKRSAWWDITKKSLLRQQMPMGARSDDAVTG